MLSVANIYADCAIKLMVADGPPFYFKDKTGNWTGLVIDHASAVITEAGCKIIYRMAPWGRALRLLEDGELDMMGLLSITDERKTFLNFIGPHYQETIKLLVAEKSDYQIRKHEDLKNLPQKIAFFRGSWYGKRIENLRKDKSFAKKIVLLSGASETLTTVEKIRMGRISGGFWAVVPGILKSDTYKGLKFHPFVINQDPVYFELSKKSVKSPHLTNFRKLWSVSRQEVNLKESCKNTNKLFKPLFEEKFLQQDLFEVGSSSKMYQ